jgi:glycosyltransferase involved in cell wall biosynthesis
MVLKTITIIVATYNAEKCVLNCLNSIRAQKLEEVELIVIDGNSKDDTVKILTENRDIIDVLVSEKDRGVYDAWNKGIVRAKGRWVMFLGADDILLPAALDTYLKYIKNNNVADLDIISSKLELVDETGFHRRYVGELFDHYKYCTRKLSFAHPGMLHSLKVLRDFNGFSLDYKICADCEFFIRNGSAFRSGFVDYVTVRMQQGGMSVSYAAVIEAFQIRQRNKVIDPISNIVGLAKISILLTLSKFKSKINLLLS